MRVCADGSVGWWCGFEILVMNVGFDVSHNC